MDFFLSNNAKYSSVVSFFDLKHFLITLQCQERFCLLSFFCFSSQGPDWPFGLSVSVQERRILLRTQQDLSLLPGGYRESWWGATEGIFRGWAYRFSCWGGLLHTVSAALRPCPQVHGDVVHTSFTPLSCQNWEFNVGYLHLGSSFKLAILWSSHCKQTQVFLQQTMRRLRLTSCLMWPHKKSFSPGTLPTVAS